jgi:hypothetical protein
VHQVPLPVPDAENLAHLAPVQIGAQQSLDQFDVAGVEPG